MRGSPLRMGRGGGVWPWRALPGSCWAPEATAVYVKAAGSLYLVPGLCSTSSGFREGARVGQFPFLGMCGPPSAWPESGPVMESSTQGWMLKKKAPWSPVRSTKGLQGTTHLLDFRPSCLCQPPRTPKSAGRRASLSAQQCCSGTSSRCLVLKHRYTQPLLKPPCMEWPRAPARVLSAPFSRGSLGEAGTGKPPLRFTGRSCRV